MLRQRPIQQPLDVLINGALLHKQNSREINSHFFSLLPSERKKGKERERERLITEGRALYKVCLHEKQTVVCSAHKIFMR